MPANNLTPDERARLSKAMNTRRWSRLPAAERAQATAAATNGRLQRYIDAVPASVTDPDERKRLAMAARRADMQLMAFNRERARAARKGEQR